ncbi:MAG: hypothetical protein Q9171_002270 [Xanthocarpia ochracea]
MVFRLSLAALAACFALGVLATPMTVDYNTAKLFPRGPEGEPFQCPDPSGTAAAKQNLVNAGAQPIDIGIAMLENGCAFKAGYSAGNNKQNDNAELGVYRNNWHMLRTHCDHFKGASEGEWYNRGQEVHNDVALATRCQRQLRDELGLGQYFSLQRGGLGNQHLGEEYGKYVGKYEEFSKSHMNDGMAIYYNIASV